MGGKYGHFRGRRGTGNAAHHSPPFLGVFSKRSTTPPPELFPAKITGTGGPPGGGDWTRAGDTHNQRWKPEVLSKSMKKRAKLRGGEARAGVGQQGGSTSIYSWLGRYVKEEVIEGPPTLGGGKISWGGAWGERTGGRPLRSPAGAAAAGGSKSTTPMEARRRS